MWFVADVASTTVAFCSDGDIVVSTFTNTDLNRRASRMESLEVIE